jgi:hypothetical protein
MIDFLHGGMVDLEYLVVDWNPEPYEKALQETNEGLAAKWKGTNIEEPDSNFAIKMKQARNFKRCKHFYLEYKHIIVLTYLHVSLQVARTTPFLMQHFLRSSIRPTLNTWSQSEILLVLMKPWICQPISAGQMHIQSTVLVS